MRSDDIVSIGLVLQTSGTGDRSSPFAAPKAVEVIQTRKFLLCRALCFWAPGKRRDGLAAMYKSMTVGSGGGSPSAVKALSNCHGSGCHFVDGLRT